MEIALVLGSGGARGYAHIGVIDELLHRGHQIVSIAGCSMGALVGGMYAAGALEDFRAFVEPLKRSEVFRYADLSVSGPGLFKSDRLMDKLHSLIGDIRIEELPIPYTAVATDLTNRREVWFHDGPLLTAVRASIAIPTAITPVVYRGRLLADGGILNPLPVDASSHFISEATVAVSLFGRNRPGLGQQSVDTGLHTEQGPTSQDEQIDPPTEDLLTLPDGVAAPSPSGGRGSQGGSGASPSSASMSAGLAGRWRERVAQPWRESAAFLRTRKQDGAEDHAESRWLGGRHSGKPGPEWSSAFEALPKDLSTVDMMVSALEVMQTAIELPRLAVQPPDVLVSVPSDVCATFDFDRAQEVIAVGRRMAVEALDRAGL
ncbi:patatin-like phospholipase family protein [Kocuria sp.]|uniref:patatin-like phospholipase family protein n=1 Tax=Kocuria sp. TaxID=1871328 RepID=UPI0026E06FAC|nr:patatin-like phospholipase family protein [Kocuria sp.]MDO5617217.1 patatin-like phospholipase family protein [Kocuria sp.]